MIENVLSLKVFFDFLLGLAILLVLFFLISGFFRTRKSQEYRKVITDMYVASKTRQLAKEDGLDLDSEYQLFKVWSKKTRKEQRLTDLDEEIEAELKEKIDEPSKKSK